MSVTTTIPVTDISGQQIFSLPRSTQPWKEAKVLLNRSGTGGAHPWLNSLTPADTLLFQFQWSNDGTNWNGLASTPFNGGSQVVKGVVVPPSNEMDIGIGQVFPAGTFFRIILTASTPLTFDGSATYA